MHNTSCGDDLFLYNSLNCTIKKKTKENKMAKPHVDLTIAVEGPNGKGINRAYTFTKENVVPGTMTLDDTYDEMGFGTPTDITYYDEKGRAIDLMSDVENFSITLNDYIDNTNLLEHAILKLLIAGALSAEDDDYQERIMQ